MNYNFKKFSGRNARLDDRISITKSFSIGFPQKFYDDNDIEEYRYVMLFWDEDNKAIGLKFTNDEEEKDKFKIIHHREYGGSINVRSFFKTYNLKPVDYKGKYTWQKISTEEGEMFVIELQKKGGKQP